MGWNLLGWSFKVIRKNKQLILFPMLSAVAAIAGLVLWFAASGLFRSIIDSPELQTRDYLLLIPAYLIVTFVIVFFNCALAACADAYFRGEHATLGYGLSHAAARIVPIIGWAVLSTTVGLILKTIEQRASWAAKIATWIFGFAWAMATYLVVPVLIAEDCGAFGSLRRSSQLLRETWGDQIVGNIRFGWRTLVVFIPGLIIGAIGANGVPLLLPVAVAYFVIGIAVISAARGIFEVALYRYAAYGDVPADWSAETVPGIFLNRPKPIE